MHYNLEKLSFNTLPQYYGSGSRQFLYGEKHIERTIEGRDILIIVRKGVLRFSENGIAKEVNAGEYYIQRSGLRQSGPAVSDSPNYFFISFTNAAFSPDGDLPMHGKYNYENINPLISALELLGLTAPKIEYASILYSILSELYKYYDFDSTAKKIHAFIVSNYAEPITIKDIENSVYLSKNQVINVFRNAYGQTPHAYLINYRLHKASDLILFTNRSFAQICSSVGINDYTVFYRAFKTKFGMSPKEYRQSFTNSTTLESPTTTPLKTTQ